MWCLLQTSHEYATTNHVTYGYVIGGLNLVFGIAAGVIIGNKGHSQGQVVLHLLIGVFCCGPWALISALAAQDFTARQQHDWKVAKRGRMQAEISELRQRLNAVDHPQTGAEARFEALPDEPLPSDMTEPEPVKWVEQPASSLPGLMEMRIKCRACGKRFSGPKGKIQLMKKCPKCGVTPFDYQQLPAKS